MAWFWTHSLWYEWFGPNLTTTRRSSGVPSKIRWMFACCHIQPVGWAAKRAVYNAILIAATKEYANMLPRRNIPCSRPRSCLATIFQCRNPCIVHRKIKGKIGAQSCGNSQVTMLEASACIVRVKITHRIFGLRAVQGRARRGSVRMMCRKKAHIEMNCVFLMLRKPLTSCCISQ